MQTLLQEKKSPLITPEYVFSRYPWLAQRNQKMITHNDLDGLLTALILQQELGWELVGVYDLTKLHVDKNFQGDLKEVIYVDLDVTHKSFRSLGHHILGEDEGDHLNINRLFGVGYNRYVDKYPLSTALFLCWLFKKDFNSFSQMAQLFLLHSDSSWKNFQSYERNVTEWFGRLGMTDILDFLKDPRVIPSIEKFVLPNTSGFNNQCGFIERNGKFVFKKGNYDMQKYVDNLSKIFGYERLIMPTNLVEKYEFKRKQFDIPSKKLEWLLNGVRQEHKVFSYSVKYINKIDVSYF